MAAALAVALSASAAVADSIVLSQGGVKFEGVKIEAVRGGHVVFADQAGRTQRRSVADVRALVLDELPALDAAEAKYAAGDYAAARDALLLAMIGASSDSQRLWVHARLARVHDRMNEYFEAAGHAAAAFAMDDDPAWAVLEPVCDAKKRTTPLSFYAIVEANDHVRAAQRSVKASALKLALDRMARVVGPVHAELSQSFEGDVPPRGSTISGVLRDAIIARAEGDAGEAQPASVESAREQVEPPSPLSSGGTGAGAGGAREEAAAAATRDDGATRDSQADAAGVEAPGTPSGAPAGLVDADPRGDEIDVLLAGGRSAEALAKCERMAGDGSWKDVARFLHQYGRALRAHGNSERALVMFARCAVLCEESKFGSQSLIETAMIYRDTLHQPATARRLLERAVEHATVHRHSTALQQAQGLLKTF